MGKLPKTLQCGGGDPIYISVLPIETRKEELPVIRRESGRILDVGAGIKSLSHVDRRGPAAMPVIKTDEEIRGIVRYARAIGLGEENQCMTIRRNAEIHFVKFRVDRSPHILRLQWLAGLGDRPVDIAMSDIAVGDEIHSSIRCLQKT